MTTKERHEREGVLCRQPWGFKSPMFFFPLNELFWLLKS
jgi:hypothetical protein